MDFTTGSEVPVDDVVAEPRTSKTVDAKAHNVVTDDSRDALLTEFGKDTLRDRYLLPGENFQDLFARVASAYADDGAHAQRVYDYISKLWFMPATPVLSNGGTGRGLPISCYLNSVSDSLDGIVGTWNENVWLASKGGGIGTYWGSVRGIGEPVGLNGKTSGIIPFVRVMDPPDAGDQPGLAAPRLGRRLPRHLAPRDRGVPRDPQTLGRLQPQGLEPPPRRARHRRVHGGGAQRRRVHPAQPQGRLGARQGRRPRAVPEAGRDPPGDRRALHHLHRRGEQVDAQASPRPGAQGHHVQPVQRDHAADRQGPSRRRPHRGLLPVVRSTSRPGTSGTATRRSSRTSCASSTTCSATTSPAPPTRWRAPNIAPSASARWAWA